MTVSILDALGAYLPTATAGFTTVPPLVLGVNLYLARFPAEAPNAAMCIQQYEGQAPTFTFGAGVAVLDSPRVQILVRGEREDYPGAYQWALAVRDVLGAVVSTTTMSGLSILRIQPSGTPNATGYDESDRPKFTINFTVTMAAV